MSVEKAKAHYIGKPGYQKLNCAQAVVRAFEDQFALSQDVVEKCATCGGGRAPDGECGALYAARVLLEKDHPEQVRACENSLLSVAGSTKCKEIRAAKKLSCVGCVETVAIAVEKGLEQ
ncbi:MAG: C-GCAxxG-C-C family (seleno)protein [Candidatus Omnitrophota bacterium]